MGRSIFHANAGYCNRLLRHTTLLVAMTAMIGSLAAGGCSNDRRVFRSTPDLPLNYTLVDTSSGQSIWSMEVPVQHRLVVDFDREDEVEFAYIKNLPATDMRWYLYTLYPKKRVDEGHVDLQGMPVLAKISYRPAPELPEDYIAPGMEDIGEGLFAPDPNASQDDQADESAPGLTDDTPTPATTQPDDTADLSGTSDKIDTPQVQKAPQSNEDSPKPRRRTRPSIRR